jgi:uncharacterized membrane protein YkvA (DUF1232 family)
MNTRPSPAHPPQAPNASVVHPTRAVRPVPTVRVGLVRALHRFLVDGQASLVGKAFLLVVLAYVVMPLDLLPDAIPVIGWLDDIGMASVALWYLTHALGPYREGLAGSPVEAEAPVPAELVAARSTSAPSPVAAPWRPVARTVID